MDQCEATKNYESRKRNGWRKNFTESEAIAKCEGSAFMSMNVMSTRPAAFRRKVSDSETRMPGPYIPPK